MSRISESGYSVVKAPDVTQRRDSVLASKRRPARPTFRFVPAAGSVTTKHIRQSPQCKAVFHRDKKPKPAAPEAKPDSELATDVKGIKAWITNTAEPARKESIRREQINRDGLADVNNQCKDGRDKTQKLWIEKDKEHESLVKEITRLNKENRDLRTELAGKANRAKSTKPAKA